jgi:uncharacterized RDD family membrane protein YckC
MRENIIIADKSFRVANFIVDSIVLSVIVLLVAALGYLIYPEMLNENSLVPDILSFVVYVSYYFFFEAFTGKTIGKLLTRTVVVNRLGGKPTLANTFIRTLLRLVPAEGISFLFGNVGLHDLISRTTVVSCRKK